MFTKWSLSDKIFAGLIILMLSGKFIWTWFELDHPLVLQWTASWTAIGVISLLSIAVYRLSTQTGFPPLWDDRLSIRQRFLIPIGLGMAVASIEIILGTVMRIPSAIHVPLPLAIPVYITGGIFLELMYRFIPLVFLVWLVSSVIFRGRRQEYVFWGFAVLLSLWEPVMQLLGMTQMGLLTNIFLGIGMFSFIFAANLIPAFIFRNYGFLAVIVWRLTDYAIWHMIWPLFWH